MRTKTWLLFPLFLLATSAMAQTIRVPQEANLQQALNRVAEGGVIEIAQGTYPSPTNGFRLDLQGRSFTVRAAAGAEVILDGQGTNRILRMGGGAGSAGETVVFENLRFENGFSDRQALGGAVTVARGEAVFRDCVLRNNRVTETSSGGGAVFVVDAAASFVGSLVEDNSAPNRGGAVVFTSARGRVETSRFLRNRVNLPPHRPNAVGGALFVLDSEVVVERSHFEGNEASFAGGAIYVFGVWREPESEPAAQAEVTDSTFVSNRTFGDPCCEIASPTFGGAIHVEDQATARVRGSLFQRNQAIQGGAINLYRAIVEVEDSVFQGNRGVPTSGRIGVGGAVVVSSSDFADSSTDFGAINRRPAVFSARSTLFQGRFEDVETTALQGGCLLAGGDETRLFGIGGVEQDGTLAENQAQVELEDVIFFDCDTIDGEGSPGIGGAIFAGVTDLQVTDSVVLDSDADATGGGLAAFGHNRVRLKRVTFANNSAGDRGGAAALLGSEVTADDVAFVRNEVSPGVNEGILDSAGAALFVAPSFGGAPERDRPATGVIRGSLFAENRGLTIVDIAPGGGPQNRMHYDDNRFRETTFGNKVYKNTLGDPAGESVAGLNALVIDGIDKARSPNRQLGSTPREGRVVAAPSALPSPVPPGSGVDERTAFLGFAWSGNPASSARLAGRNLADRTGLLAIDEAGDFSLTVDGNEVDRTTVSACTTDTKLCLGGDRFEVEVQIRDFSGAEGQGRVVPLSTTDSGLFFFFDPNNWEILVKVLNGCPINNRVWVFSAATTNVEYTLTVTDRVTGESQSYFNPLGTAAPAITDTSALAVCDAGMLAAETATSDQDQWIEEEVASLRRVLEAGGSTACTPDDASLCLNRDRFRVEVDFEDFSGFMGQGKTVPVSTDDSGLFFFFDPDNWEILVKVLNGCPINDRVWVFSAATTNVEYTLRVTDTETGAVQEYFNPLGTRAAAVTDTEAFVACP